MRIAPTALFASVLVVAFAASSRAGDSGSPLEKADRIERAGREMIEHGHRVEGAKTIAEAWRIRADVWAHEQAEAKERAGAPPEFDALREKIAKLKAMSGEAERAGHDLKAAGKQDDANAKMEESGRLWREAEALEAKLRDAEQARRESGGGDDRTPDQAAREQRIVELKTQLARAREEISGAEQDVKKAQDEGAEKAEAAAKERAERLRQRARELEAKLAEVAGGGKRGVGGQGGLEAQVESLRRQLEEMRRAFEELRHRLDAK